MGVPHEGNDRTERGGERERGRIGDIVYSNVVCMTPRSRAEGGVAGGVGYMVKAELDVVGR